jgi:hypothetical protein
MDFVFVAVIVAYFVINACKDDTTQTANLDINFYKEII